MIPLDSKKILIGTGFKCRRIGEETNDETGDFIHLNPPSKFPNQGVLAFPRAPCEPNFRITATENWRDGIPKARTAGGMKRKEIATKPPYNLMKDLSTEK
jgi:hypothetical protein